MQVVAGYRQLAAPLREAVVAIGTFDGVHRGHQALLSAAVSAAHLRGGTPCVYTFDPHPTHVVAPDSSPPMLCSLSRKLELMAAAGIELCVVEPFTREFAAQSADTFTDSILAEALGAREVIVGWDWTYGKGRAGNPESLAAAGARVGFSVRTIAALFDGDLPVSSTRIRRALAEGAVAEAARLLGRPYDVRGTVVHGAKRGRTIGYPTANLATDVPLPVATGIYAGWVNVAGQRYRGAASVGRNPTFVDGGPVTLEVYLLDFAGDLYDQSVQFSFVQRLRGEVKFTDVDSLVAQIAADVEATRRCLPLP